MTLPEFQRRFSKLDLNRELSNAIQDSYSSAVALNKGQLFNRGEDSEGNKLKYNSTFYALDKNKSNPLPGFGNADLFVTGAFYNGFYAQVKGNKSVIFGSTDPKTSKLEDRFGKKIFGLTKDNRKVFAVEILRPKLEQYITKTIGTPFK